MAVYLSCVAVPFELLNGTLMGNLSLEKLTAVFEGQSQWQIGKDGSPGLVDMG